MSDKESRVRYTFSLIFLFASFYFTSYLLGLLAVMLMLTASTKYCTIYDMFELNKDIYLETLFLKYLPKHNPEPVFILDENARTIFQNEPAKNYLNLNNFLDLFEEFSPKEIIKDKITLQKQYYCDTGKTYLITFKAVEKFSYILAYATDITSVLKAEEEVLNTQKDVVYTMGAIGETRSKETGNHVKRVAIYSEILALKAGLSKEEAKLLKLASPMHDIGKVGIEDAILNKPGKLTFEEFEIMKTHAQLGYEMLRNSDKEILKAAATVAHEHHEKWDGSGYPRALKGEDIHIYGRITALADVFDALGSDRVYKKAWPLEKILDLFKEQSGKHFDPKLVDLFFEHFDEFNEVRLKYQDK